MSKHKEGLQRERDKLIGEVAKLTERLNNALSYQEELEARASQVDLKLTEVTTQLEVNHFTKFLSCIFFYVLSFFFLGSNDTNRSFQIDEGQFTSGSLRIKSRNNQ